MPSAVPISAQSNVHREENQPRSFRSIGGFGGRSFTAQGLSFTGPGSFIVSPRFGSYTRAAALLGTSLGKSPLDFEMNCGSLETEHGLPFNFSRAESEFCKNYNCCGLDLPDLHDLIQHYEEAHVVVLDDSKSKHDEELDPAEVDDMDLGTSPSNSKMDRKMSIGAIAAIAAQNAANNANHKSNNMTSAFETSILHSNPRGVPTSLHAKAPLGSFGPPFSPNLESADLSSAPETPDDDEDMFDAEPSSSLSSHSSNAITSMPLFPSSSKGNDRPQCVTPGLLFPTSAAQRGAADATMKAYQTNNSSPSNNNNNQNKFSNTNAINNNNNTNNNVQNINVNTASSDDADTPTGGNDEFNDKPFRCPNPGCSKAYRQANGLKYHRLHGQCNYVVRDGMEQDGLTLAEAEAVARPYLCQVGHCDKRYKNMNGLRYHYAHSGTHGAIGLAMLSNGSHPTPPPPPAHVRERKDRERKAVAAAAQAAGLPIPPASPDEDEEDFLGSLTLSPTNNPNLGLGSEPSTPLLPKSSSPATPTLANTTVGINNTTTPTPSLNMQF